MKIFGWLFKHIPGVPGLPGLSSGLLNPWVLLGLLSAAASLFGYGCYVGKRWSDGAHARAELVAERAWHQAYVAKEAKYQGAEQELFDARGRRRIVTRTITQEVNRVVEKPIYRNVCLDADGLRLANDALAGRAPDPAKPHATVPGAHAAR